MFLSSSPLVQDAWIPLEILIPKAVNKIIEFEKPLICLKHLISNLK